MSVERWTKTINEDEPLPVAARLVNPATQDPLLLADVNTITRNVWLKSDGSLVSTTSLNKVDTIFDSLQAWDKDGVGYNFRDIIPASCFPDGPAVYDVEHTLTMTVAVNGPLHVIGKATTVAIRSS